MGGGDNSEPPLKRVKKNSKELGEVSKNSSFSKSISPLEGMGDTVDSGGVIKKVEFVRIITQALSSLGYERSRKALEEESGIELHSSAVDLFRKQVLDGNWDGSMTELHKIGIVDEHILKSVSFLILEHKFFEFLQMKKFTDALKMLRTEITPLSINKDRVHKLSCCIISDSQYALLEFANQNNGTVNSRIKLLQELNKFLSPVIMIPSGRLEHLIEQALSAQKEGCLLHNSLDYTPSLYTDHRCGEEQIPSQTTQVLMEHKGEVWFLQFSNNGKYLASSSNDRSVIIWKVNEEGEVTVKNKLIGHQEPIFMIAWSPDDSQILSCGMEGSIMRWDVSSGACLQLYKKRGLRLISCGWVSIKQKIFAGTANGRLYIWDLDGTEGPVVKVNRTIKTMEAALSKYENPLICMLHENSILSYDGESMLHKLIEEEQPISSFSLSRDDSFLLVNVDNQEIHLWNIAGDPKLVVKYKGHKCRRYVIRSCFGGYEQAFIASGSEDSQVYIWLRSTGKLICVLPGHRGSVNCVSWNPVNPHMLASASDDHTIHIWGLNRVNLKKAIVSDDTLQSSRNC